MISNLGLNDNAETLFNSLRTAEDVHNLINQSQEENLYIDYKEAKYSNNKIRDDDKINFTIALSGFANTEGGILVWGIQTGKDKTEDIPEKIIPIINLAGFRQELERRILTSVKPRVDGVQFRPIDIDGINQGVLIMLVPESSYKPHMAMSEGEYRYYRRISSSFTKMEHGEIESLFARKYRLTETPQIVLQVTKLNFDNLIVVAANLGNAAAIKINANVEVKNKSGTIKEYKWLEPIILPNQTLEFIISNDRSTKQDVSLDTNDEENPDSPNSNLLSPYIFYISGQYENAYGERYMLTGEFDLSNDQSDQTGNRIRYIRRGNELVNSMKELGKKIGAELKGVSNRWC